MTVARTVADVLTEHVTFEVECIDRMYLNMYQPKLQYAAGFVDYVHRRLGMPIASTAPLAKITDRLWQRCTASPTMSTSSVWPIMVAAKGHLDRARRLGLQANESTLRFADEHVAVLYAVLSGDRPMARDRMRTHLRSVFGDIEKIRQRSPELFAAPESAPVRRSVAVWQ